MRIHAALAFFCLVAACDSPSSSGGATSTSTASQAADTRSSDSAPSPDDPDDPTPDPDDPTPDPDDPGPDPDDDPDPDPDPVPGPTPDPDPGPGPGPGPSACEGDWTLGSTFYHGDDLGTACAPHNAPQNCVKGDFIMFGDTGECICIVECADFQNVREGDKCASSAGGDWTCQRIRATNASENGGLYCVPDAWDLCTEGGGPGPSPDPDPTPECAGAGASCGGDSDCCSGTCDFFDEVCVD